MSTGLVEIRFHKIMQTRSYTVIMLGTEAKKFAIYTEPQVGKILQMYLTQSEKERPLTHDLINTLFNGLNVRVLQVVIKERQDTVYFARLFLEQKCGEIQKIVELDVRPSDALILALMNQAPVYCTSEVFEKVIPVED